MGAWIVGVLIIWVLVALALAVVLGRAIRLADVRSPGTGARLSTADLPSGFTPDLVPGRR